MADRFAEADHPDKRARPNESTLMRAVDQAFAGAVAEVFNRMVRDLEHAQLPAARVDMKKRMDTVQTVHAEMRQRAEDLDTWSERKQREGI